MTFAQRLRELRDGVGLSEARLAHASGVSNSAIHEYGLGRRKPSFEAVVKLAKALGVTCEAFAGCVDMGQDEPASMPTRGRPRKDAAPAMPPAADMIGQERAHQAPVGDVKPGKANKPAAKGKKKGRSSKAE